MSWLPYRLPSFTEVNTIPAYTSVIPAPGLASFTEVDVIPAYTSVIPVPVSLPASFNLSIKNKQHHPSTLYRKKHKRIKKNLSLPLPSRRIYSCKTKEIKKSLMKN